MYQTQEGGIEMTRLASPSNAGQALLAVVGNTVFGY